MGGLLRSVAACWRALISFSRADCLCFMFFSSLCVARDWWYIRSSFVSDVGGFLVGVDGDRRDRLDDVVVLRFLVLVLADERERAWVTLFFWVLRFSSRVRSDVSDFPRVLPPSLF